MTRTLQTVLESLPELDTAIAADPILRKQFQAAEGKYAPKAHARNRAQRYIEKRFLRLLWREWRKTGVSS